MNYYSPIMSTLDRRGHGHLDPNISKTCTDIALRSSSRISRWGWYYDDQYSHEIKVYEYNFFIPLKVKLNNFRAGDIEINYASVYKEHCGHMINILTKIGFAATSSTGSLWFDCRFIYLN